MPTRCALVIAPIALTLSPVALAGGSVDVDVQRTSTYTIQTGSGSFGGAGGGYEIRWDFAAQLDDYKQGFTVNEPGDDLTIVARRTARNFFATGAGDVQVSNFQFNPDVFEHGALEVDWSLNRDDKFDLDIEGTLRAGYEFDAVEGLPSGRRNESFLFTRIEQGHHVMRFLGGGEGLVDTGDGFAVDVVLDGMWDPSSIDAGGVSFIGIDDGYQITEFFVYDAATDTTRLRAVSDSYLRDPRLRFDLIGAAVPAPAALAAFLAFAGLNVRRSRR